MVTSANRLENSQVGAGLANLIIDEERGFCDKHASWRKDHISEIITEGEIRLDTEKIAFILLDHTDQGCMVKVTLIGGEKTTLAQDGNTIVSAASSVGLYTIPFHRLRSISFV